MINKISIYIFLFLLALAIIPIIPGVDAISILDGNTLRYTNASNISNTAVDYVKILDLSPTLNLTGSFTVSVEMHDNTGTGGMYAKFVKNGVDLGGFQGCGMSPDCRNTNWYTYSAIFTTQLNTTDTLEVWGHPTAGGNGSLRNLNLSYEYGSFNLTNNNINVTIRPKGFSYYISRNGSNITENDANSSLSYFVRDNESNGPSGIINSSLYNANIGQDVFDGNLTHATLYWNNSIANETIVFNISSRIDKSGTERNNKPVDDVNITITSNIISNGNITLWEYVIPLLTDTKNDSIYQRYDIVWLNKSLSAIDIKMWTPYIQRDGDVAGIHSRYARYAPDFGIIVSSRNLNTSYFTINMTGSDSIMQYAEARQAGDNNRILRKHLFFSFGFLNRTFWNLTDLNNPEPSIQVTQGIVLNHNLSFTFNNEEQMLPDGNPIINMTRFKDTSEFPNQTVVARDARFMITSIVGTRLYPLWYPNETNPNLPYVFDAAIPYSSFTSPSAARILQGTYYFLNNSGKDVGRTWADAIDNMNNVFKIYVWNNFEIETYNMSNPLNWNYYCDVAYSGGCAEYTDKGDPIDMMFTGDKVTIKYEGFLDRGTFNVSVDNGTNYTVDTFSLVQNQTYFTVPDAPYDYNPGLNPQWGTHTVRIYPLGYRTFPSDLTDGNVLWLELNDNANDRSGYNNHGTANASVNYVQSLVRPGYGNTTLYGNASNFTSSLGTIKIPNSSSLVLNTTTGRGYAVSFWSKIPPTTDYVFQVSKCTPGNSNPYPFDIYKITGTQTMQAFINPGGSIQFNQSVVDNTWQMWTISIDDIAKTYRYWMNTTVAATGSYTGSITPYDIGQEVRVGMRCDNYTSSAGAKGAIDDVKIYNHPINDSIVAGLYSINTRVLIDRIDVRRNDTGDQLFAYTHREGLVNNWDWTEPQVKVNHSDISIAGTDSQYGDDGDYYNQTINVTMGGKVFPTNVSLYTEATPSRGAATFGLENPIIYYTILKTDGATQWLVDRIPRLERHMKWEYGMHYDVDTGLWYQPFEFGEAAYHDNIMSTGFRGAETAMFILDTDIMALLYDAISDSTNKTFWMNVRDNVKNNALKPAGKGGIWEDKTAECGGISCGYLLDSLESHYPVRIEVEERDFENHTNWTRFDKWDKVGTGWISGRVWGGHQIDEKRNPNTSIWRPQIRRLYYTNTSIPITWRNYSAVDVEDAHFSGLDVVVWTDSVYGILNVTISNSTWNHTYQVDLYSPTANAGVIKPVVKNLSWGGYKVQFVKSGQKNPSASDYTVNLDAIDVYDFALTGVQQYSYDAFTLNIFPEANKTALKNYIEYHEGKGVCDNGNKLKTDWMYPFVPIGLNGGAYGNMIELGVESWGYQGAAGNDTAGDSGVLLDCTFENGGHFSMSAGKVARLTGNYSDMQPYVETEKGKYGMFEYYLPNGTVPQHYVHDLGTEGEFRGSASFEDQMAGGFATGYATIWSTEKYYSASNPTFNLSVYNLYWQPVFVNKTDTLQNIGSSSNIRWVVKWNATTQWFRVFFNTWPINMNEVVNAGDAVLIKYYNNQTIIKDVTNTTYYWDIKTKWNLVGLETDNKNLSQVNTSINNGRNCEADKIVYTNLSTNQEYIFTCNQVGNASVIVNRGEGFWVNSTNSFNVTRTW